MSKLKWLWDKLPVIVRGIIVGMIVQILGVMPIFWLLMANVQRSNEVPWAFFVGLIYLWVFWSYIKGKGWPNSTSKVRSKYVRFNTMDAKLRTWSIISGFLFTLTLAGMIIWSWLLVSWPTAQAELLQTFVASPKWTIIPLLALGALSTGIVEESAYRGYMQVPIENRHGPAIGIGVVAVVFALSHPLPPTIVPFFIVGSLGWGVLAYLANSTLPGMIFHTLIDLSFYVWGLYNVESLGNMQSFSVLENGVTSFFLYAVIFSVIFGAATVVSFYRLAKMKKVGSGQ